MLRTDTPGELARVEGYGHIVCHGSMESLRKVVVGPPLWIDGSKVPKLVLYDRPANVSANVLLGKAVCRGTGKWEVLYVAYGAAGREVAKNVAMDFVAAALGDDVEDASGGLAVFGSVGAGLDFHFLH